MTCDEKIMEYARMLDAVRSRFPDTFRHIVGLMRSLLQ